MRILLDENMPAKVKYDFGKGYDVNIKRYGLVRKKEWGAFGIGSF